MVDERGLADLGAVLEALARLEDAIDRLAASVPPPPVAYVVPVRLKDTTYMEA